MGERLLLLYNNIKIIEHCNYKLNSLKKTVNNTYKDN